MSERFPEVTIYVDGGCFPNPGLAAWAAILIFGGHVKALSGHEERSTNNRAELLAAIGGLEALKKPCTVTIISDSQWLIQCGAGAWSRGSHPELWARLDAAAKTHIVEYKWVRGHDGNAYNERAHNLVQVELRKHEREQTR